MNTRLQQVIDLIDTLTSDLNTERKVLEEIIHFITPEKSIPKNVDSFVLQEYILKMEATGITGFDCGWVKTIIYEIDGVKQTNDNKLNFNLKHYPINVQSTTFKSMVMRLIMDEVIKKYNVKYYIDTILD